MKDGTENLKGIFLSIDEHLEDIVDELFVRIEISENFNIIVEFSAILRSRLGLRERLDWSIVFDFFGVSKWLAFRQ